jgi:hypothetical protein
MRELGTLVNEQAVAVGKLESLYSVDLSYLWSTACLI